ncbi:MAG: SusD/RagB family nutrient-binding outer membrane lipoprotein [Gemmatimonadota bacterium]|nr:SusD/RagB family nutrient-binding outer membrane lipoprotein [Gemmatimonadota bacterium]
MIKPWKIAPVAALAVLGVAACSGDFLSGGQLSTDPNRPTAASAQQLLAGVQSNLFAYWGSDPARVTGMWVQQFQGLISQYVSLYQYAHDETTTNGFHAGLYSGGGLIDLRKSDSIATKANDKHTLGIGQILEGALMGTGADLFGDLVYSHALQNLSNPPLDKQQAVYDSVQKVMSAGIVNMASNNTTDVGPGQYDLNYGGDPTAWTKLAHTLKARFYMHTAKVDSATAYPAALAEAMLGLDDPTIDFKGTFQTTPLAETNFYYQFNGPAGRGGYMGIDPQFVNLLVSRNDPRISDYIDTTANYVSNTRNQPGYQQTYVSTAENLLIWSEAAYRTGDQATALAKLNQERAMAGLGPDVAAAAGGQALLTEILTEEYINDFQLGEEAWNLYKRTCFPNLTPTVSGLKIPRRFYYDAGERQTNTSIPNTGTGSNGSFNQLDPSKTTSDGGGACLGQ